MLSFFTFINMVIINVSLNSNFSSNFEIISLKDVNVNDNVKSLKNKINSIRQVDTEKINIIHSGNLLKDEEFLHEVGIENESMVYCLPQNDTSLPVVPPLSLIEVQQLLVSLRTATSSPNFRSYIEKLRTSEQIARLVTECPALKKDPSSLAYIQDPDLVSMLQNVNSLSQVIEDRPVIGRVLQIVCTLITSEISSPRSHHVSYSMDALSDEEMEIDQNEIDLRTGSTGTSAFQPITPAQLAAALANATGSPGGQIGWGGPSSSAPRSGLTTPSSIPTPLNTPAPSGAGGGASPGGSLITTEMFSQALQNALAASASSSTGALSGSSPMGSTAPIENVEESLQLMREMGIPDEELSLQALQATNGDVEAAVNLIYAQWMADD